MSLSQCQQLIDLKGEYTYNAIITGNREMGSTIQGAEGNYCCAPVITACTPSVTQPSNLRVSEASQIIHPRGFWLSNQ